MKRPVLIIIGIVVVIILITIWVVMLLIGSPENGEGTFADFNFGDTTDTTFVEPEDSGGNEEPVVDMTETDKLRQLTTEPVAGFREIQADASSTPEVRYVAAGTGHIFSINTETGAENRISATTIPVTTKAEISSDGSSVFMQSGFGAGSTYLVGTLSDTGEDLQTVELDGRVVSFGALDDGRFVYATLNPSSVTARVYNPISNSQSELFTIPFRDAAFDWGSDVNGPHYVYPKAAADLEGYLYVFENNILSRKTIDGFGMSAVSNTAGSIFSEVVEREYQSRFYSELNGELAVPGTAYIPEKCTAVSATSATFYCAAELREYSGLKMPDAWYMGDVINSDILWEIDVENGSAELLVDLQAESGRIIDAVTLDPSVDTVSVYFTNRTDRTLWVFDKQ